MRHVISVLVRNKPGVLARVVGLFSARGYNIESLVVGQTDDPAISRMVIVVPGDATILEQVRKQLSKLIDTLKVTDFCDTECVTRDLCLVKVRAEAAKRHEILDIVNVFGGKVLHLAQKHLILQFSGDENALERLLQILQPYGIIESMRTGRVAMARE